MSWKAVLGPEIAAEGARDPCTALCAAASEPLTAARYIGEGTAPQAGLGDPPVKHRLMLRSDREPEAE